MTTAIDNFEPPRESAPSADKGEKVWAVSILASGVKEYGWVPQSKVKGERETAL